MLRALRLRALPSQTEARIVRSSRARCRIWYGQLPVRGEPVCFPLPAVTSERQLSATGLYDVCLAINLRRRVVGNEVNADGKDLVIITGANQGGKSTFLRSIGLSQLMMQCGMFVPGQVFHANVCQRIFTHYKREEDAAMNSGKFDEELSRMSDIIEYITPNSLVLFNESFAATNEREGSEIARQVVTALSERRIKVVFVTHQYKFARAFDARDLPTVLFLRAERRPMECGRSKSPKASRYRRAIGRSSWASRNLKAKASDFRRMVPSVPKIVRPPYGVTAAGRPRPVHAVARARHHAFDPWPRWKLERNSVTDPKFQHFRVRSHSFEKPKPRDDAVVEVDKLTFVQGVDIDLHQDPIVCQRKGDTRRAVSFS